MTYKRKYNVHTFKINDEQMEEIREHVYSILRIVKREEVIDAMNEAIPEMNKEQFENELRFRDICGTLFDVSRYCL